MWASRVGASRFLRVLKLRVQLAPQLGRQSDRQRYPDARVAVADVSVRVPSKVRSNLDVPSGRRATGGEPEAMSISCTLNLR